MSINDLSFSARLPVSAEWADAAALRAPAAPAGPWDGAGLFDADALARDLGGGGTVLSVSARTAAGDVNALAQAVIGHLCE